MCTWCPSISWVSWLKRGNYHRYHVPTSFTVFMRYGINALLQRFSNWGPWTKGGPRRVPTGSARGFRKVVIVCTVFNNLQPACFQICTRKSATQSQRIAWKCCRGLARQAFCWCLLVVLRVICWLLWWSVHPFCGRWCCASVIKKQSCIRYSKRRKFRPKMRQNAFGGRAPPGPAGEASALPQTL